MFRIWFFLFLLLGLAEVRIGFAQTISRFEWRDIARNRIIPVKIYWPTHAKPRPTVLVSHGLGGSREGLQYLGVAWSKAGFLCVHLQHEGSDERVWRGSRTPMAAMKKAVANPQNAVSRAQDVSFVLDELMRLNQTKDSPFFGRVDAGKIAVAGHSFGAWTALAASGRGAFGDARVRACVALSAPAQSWEQEKRAFSRYKTPTLFFTGTKDESPIGGTGAKDRRIPFDAVSRGPAFLGILNDATHATFGGGKGDPRHQELILAATNLFWQAFLLDDSKAKRELENFSAILGVSGNWEHK